MRRVITRNLGKRLIVGKVYNFPYQTWEGIAKSANMDLDEFSEMADQAASRSVSGVARSINNKPVIVEPARRGPGRPRAEAR